MGDIFLSLCTWQTFCARSDGKTKLVLSGQTLSALIKMMHKRREDK